MIKLAHLRISLLNPNFNVITGIRSIKSDPPSTKVVSQNNDDTEYEMKGDRLLDFDAQSLESRGYFRSQKSYDPPPNVENTILNECKKIGLPEVNFAFNDPSVKYNLLKTCSVVLDHSIPNSLLHKICNRDELILFYKTPVNQTVPLDMMKDISLPKNIHVLYKYVRFHPETDTKFGGVTAFPQSSTIVSNIKNKKRYPGFVAKKKFPY